MRSRKAGYFLSFFLVSGLLGHTCAVLGSERTLKKSSKRFYDNVGHESAQTNKIGYSKKTPRRVQKPTVPPPPPPSQSTGKYTSSAKRTPTGSTQPTPTRHASVLGFVEVPPVGRITDCLTEMSKPEDTSEVAVGALKSVGSNESPTPSITLEGKQFSDRMRRRMNSALDGTKLYPENFVQDAKPAPTKEGELPNDTPGVYVAMREICTWPQSEASLSDEYVLEDPVYDQVPKDSAVYDKLPGEKKSYKAVQSPSALYESINFPAVTSQGPSKTSESVYQEATYENVARPLHHASADEILRTELLAELKSLRPLIDDAPAHQAQDSSASTGYGDFRATVPESTDVQQCTSKAGTASSLNNVGYYQRARLNSVLASLDENSSAAAIKRTMPQTGSSTKALDIRKAISSIAKLRVSATPRHSTKSSASNANSSPPQHRHRQSVYSNCSELGNVHSFESLPHTTEVSQIESYTTDFGPYDDVYENFMLDKSGEMSELPQKEFEQSNSLMLAAPTTSITSGHPGVFQDKRQIIQQPSSSLSVAKTSAESGTHPSTPDVRKKALIIQSLTSRKQNLKAENGWLAVSSSDYSASADTKPFKNRSHTFSTGSRSPLAADADVFERVTRCRTLPADAQTGSQSYRQPKIPVFLRFNILKARGPKTYKEVIEALKKTQLEEAQKELTQQQRGVLKKQ